MKRTSLIAAVMTVGLALTACSTDEADDTTDDAPPAAEEEAPEETEEETTEEDDMGGETSEDMAEDTGDMAEDTGDMAGETGDMAGETGDMAGETGDMAGETGDMAGETGDMAGETGGMAMADPACELFFTEGGPLSDRADDARDALEAGEIVDGATYGEVNLLEQRIAAAAMDAPSDIGGLMEEVNAPFTEAVEAVNEGSVVDEETGEITLPEIDVQGSADAQDELETTCQG
ncbi:MAG: hypothetical protein M3520_04690 [Actinomycetota bacterium]|nr:hypothetical protein [Actinomycetota bacterium]